VEFSYYLPMPHHLQSRRAVPYLTGELEAFKKAVEEWTGTTITEEGLNRGSEVMNRSRGLTRALYDLRRRPDPPVTGLESMRVVAASQMVDKREYNEALQETLDRLPERAGRDGSRVRLMMLGSENDDVAFVEMVESLGAIFVIDDHCTGSRYFWNEVLTDRKPMESIAARYVDRIPCPTKDWPERRRIEHIRQLAKDWNVQGAIVVQQKFCDPHEIDIPAIIKALKQDGVPAQVLELDVTVPLGQFKTRIEAFLEILKEEDLF
jgi:benzoyl-CoA reductase subunit C